MNRGWSVVLAGFGVNLALGILYTWSMIGAAIPADWGWTDEQKSWPYAICCLVFSLMMVPAGRLQDRISPRWVATLGGILVGLGMILASRDTSYLNYVVGFGLLAGMGIGCGYAAATPPAVKWFPAAKTGLIAGIVVSGFGLASAYAAPLTQWLVHRPGGVPETMLILGIAFLVAVVLLAQFLRTPPPGYVPVATQAAATKVAAKREDSRPLEMMRTNQFYLLWFMYACGAGAGLMVISKMKSIADEQAGLKLGFILVAALAVGNGAGRVLAGMASDRLGRKPTIIGCLLFQAALMVLLTFATKGSALATMWILPVISALIGANYGANLALYPSVTKDYYGLKNFGVNYGLVFTAWGVGGFALSWLAGRLHDQYDTYTYACYVATGLLIMAAVVATFLRPPRSEAQQQPA